MPDGSTFPGKWMTPAEAVQFLGLRIYLPAHWKFLSEKNRHLLPYEPRNILAGTCARIDRAWVHKMRQVMDCGIPFRIAMELLPLAVFNADGSITLPRVPPQSAAGVIGDSDA